MTLIAVSAFSTPDSMLSLVAQVNGNSTQCITHRDGIYEVGHFGSSATLPNFEHYPDFGDRRGSYGVCDDVVNLLTAYPELEAPGREFVVRMTPVLKANQDESGGWRWQKWGEYIGNQNPSGCEYLYDEPTIEKVFCYSIYERLPSRAAA